jgi:radical SAM superfamily enzyme YgiQ (UPF0313 family)
MRERVDIQRIARTSRRERPMKILFVNPRFPKSLWGFQGLADIVGVRSGQAPLGLVTVAAMTPPEIEVELHDENCTPLQLDTDADVVAIGCWNVHYQRAIELAREFRSRGKYVVVGGPYPSLCPERFADGTFDTVVIGEAEFVWPEFCRDLLAGAPKPEYRQVGNVDVARSPVPRFDLLPKGDYLYYFVQTTRGCPFQCEFCDIIITDGRVPRTKPVAQVVKEIEAIAALGGQYVSFSDANFIGNVKYAETLLEALIAFGKANGYPLTFSAEMTVTVAERPRLLELMREANFTGIFLGIESPRLDSLVETKKRQNVHKPLLDTIRKIQSYNMVVVAGMIVGFDHDDVRIFEEQFDFLMEAGIPFTTCGVLTALEKTPLHARLGKEGRLIPFDSSRILGHGAADLNFVPKQMTVDEVKQGYNWLIRSLYAYDNYSARLVRALRQYRPRTAGMPSGSGRFERDMVRILSNVLRYFVFTGSRKRRDFFLRTIREVMRTEPSTEKLITAISYMIAHKHFHEYVTDTHGDPETVAARSPFAAPERLAGWWHEERGQAVVKRLKRERWAPAQWAARLRPARRAVAIPEAVLTERTGECLRRFLNELGVEVVPFATAALSRLKDQADVVVLPIVGSVQKGREELYQLVQQLNERMQSEFGRLPRIVRFSLDSDSLALFEAFARIGLTFTSQVERLRQAYVNAVDAVMVPAGQPTVREA